MLLITTAEQRGASLFFAVTNGQRPSVSAEQGMSTADISLQNSKKQRAPSADGT